MKFFGPSTGHIGIYSYWKVRQTVRNKFLMLRQFHGIKLRLKQRFTVPRFRKAILSTNTKTAHTYLRFEVSVKPFLPVKQTN